MTQINDVSEGGPGNRAAFWVWAGELISGQDLANLL